METYFLVVGATEAVNGVIALGKLRAHPVASVSSHPMWDAQRGKLARWR